MNRFGFRKRHEVSHRASSVIRRDAHRDFGQLVMAGEILLKDFMRPARITQRGLARAIDVPPIRISEIIRGKRAISADTALRLAAFFSTTPQFWLSLQTNWELSRTAHAHRETYARIQPHQG